MKSSFTKKELSYIHKIDIIDNIKEENFSLSNLLFNEKINMLNKFLFIKYNCNLTKIEEEKFLVNSVKSILLVSKEYSNIYETLLNSMDILKEFLLNNINKELLKKERINLFKDFIYEGCYYRQVNSVIYTVYSLFTYFLYPSNDQYFRTMDMAIGTVNKEMKSTMVYGDNILLDYFKEYFNV